MSLSLTFAEAQNEVLDLFKAAWDTTTLEAFYEDLPADRLETNESFVHVMFRISGGDLAAFGNGTRIYERGGSLVCDLYTPVGKPLSDMLGLAKVIADAFEGKHTPGGVWFRSIDIQNYGKDGLFYITNMTVRFKFHEVK
jgi:hypothetical protein